jgi:hypothetical protein
LHGIFRRLLTYVYRDPVAAGMACNLAAVLQSEDDDDESEHPASHASHISPILTPAHENVAHQEITRANGPLLPTSNSSATSALISR